MPSPQPIPVRPTYPQRSSRYFELACWACVRAATERLGGRDPVAVARALDDDAGEVAAGLLMLQRSATSGASMKTPGWASELVTTGLSDFLTGLMPQSAMAAVIGAGTIVPLAEFAALTLPYRVPVPTGSWVGESQPIPVAALSLSSATLAPKKAGILLTFSRELAQYAGAEAIFTTMLRASAAATIDGLYLSASAASADGLAGLLNGTVALTTTGTALGDIDLLAKACQGLDGSGETLYVTTPALASALDARNDISPETTILASVAVPAGRLIGIDPAGIAHTVNPAPLIEATDQALIHLDSAPLNIGTVGAPATIAAPTQSMFQTAQVVLRCLIDIGFVKWRANAVQFVDAVAW